MAKESRPKLSRALAQECDRAADEIVADAIAIAPADGSLRGAAALLLAAHELGLEPRRDWARATLAGLDELDASFFDGMLGSAWVLSHTRASIDSREIDLAPIDAAVLEALAPPWDGALAPFGGGLAGFGLYGVERRRSPGGRRIVARCVEIFDDIAVRSGSELRWTPGVQALPEGVRGHVDLLNLEGSAAAVGFLAAAARAEFTRALPLAKAGGRTLASDVDDVRNELVGAAANVAVPGVIHGSGTWALGGAGIAAALLGVARATGIKRDLDAASRFGRQLADADPAACQASDASLGTGTAGIAVVLHALYEATGTAVFRIAAEYWYRRTLRCRTPGETLHYDALRSASEGGSHWAARPGFLDGGIGTALALRCAGRGTSAGWCACLLL